MTANPRIAYLSFFFPPSRASGVYRARATANFLAERGWDVTAFAGPVRFFADIIGSTDDELAATVDPRVRIVRPTMSTYNWNRDLRQFSRFQATFPGLAKRIHNLGLQWAFPEAYYTWGLASVAKALRMHARRRFHVLLATGNPFASFGAAWLFHRLTGVPYVIDYRDSWTLDIFNDGPAFPEDHNAWTWERRVIGSAAQIVFVNENLRDWHAKRYPDHADRMMVVPNGWDAELLQIKPEATPIHRPVRFAYLGTLTHNQPVEPMVQALAYARMDPMLDGAQLHIYGYLGFFAGSPGTLLDRLGLLPDGQGVAEGHDLGVRYLGPVAKTQTTSVYEEADVLVFLAGGGRYVTSGKIFEYMASGRPIVSVHAPGVAAEEVLAGYPLWFSAHSLEPTEIGKAMVAAARAAANLTGAQRAEAMEYARLYTREAVLAPLEQRLRTTASRKEPE